MRVVLTKIRLKSIKEDGLTIAAKGLGLEQVFLNLVKVNFRYQLNVNSK